MAVAAAGMALYAVGFPLYVLQVDDTIHSIDRPSPIQISPIQSAVRCAASHRTLSAVRCAASYRTLSAVRCAASHCTFASLLVRVS
jgi:hypothetical protein